MFDSPLSASPYEVLGVDPTASDEELRRAYRLRLRQSHPDTGGDAAVFIRVQHAWELIGTAQARAGYDRGRDDDARRRWARHPSPGAFGGTRPRTRVHGEAGGWRRRRYVELAAEWAGHDLDENQAYDPTFVRTAPWDVRRMLADALAEEATGEMVEELGIGFTAWHDVAVGTDAAHKLDHIVLGPSGLFALMSEDVGDTVRFRQGEAIGPALGQALGQALGGSTPIADLLGRARAVARAAKVRFGGAILVLPDDDLEQAVVPLGELRGIPTVALRRSALRGILRAGVPGGRIIGGNELFDVRTRLAQTVTHV